LGPYQSLALFAVPVVILEPAKPLSAYLIGTGHFFPGAIVFMIAEVIKLTVVERFFQLNKKKLLSVTLFAWAYGYWRKIMDYLMSTAAWRASSRIFAEALEGIRRLKTKLHSRFHSAGPSVPTRRLPSTTESLRQGARTMRERV